MHRNRDEVDRPIEWLRKLQQDPSWYRRLLEEAGGLAAAACRLATARCRARASWVSVPTGAELHVAAREIQRFVPSLEAIPSVAMLVEDCVEAGLPVIPPRAA